MKKITALTLFQTAEGMRISMVYSDISDRGVILKDNSRVDRILVDEQAQENATALMSYAQKCIEEVGD